MEEAIAVLGKEVAESWLELELFLLILFVNVIQIALFELTLINEHSVPFRHFVNVLLVESDRGVFEVQYTRCEVLVEQIAESCPLKEAEHLKTLVVLETNAMEETVFSIFYELLNHVQQDQELTLMVDLLTIFLKMLQKGCL